MPLDQTALDLRIGSVQVAKNGCAAPGKDVEGRAQEVMKKPQWDLVLDVHQGDSEAEVLACDLSHEYVSINADYRT